MKPVTARPWVMARASSTDRSVRLWTMWTCRVGFFNFDIDAIFAFAILQYEVYCCDKYY